LIKSIIFKRKEGVGREEGRAREKIVFNFLKMALCIGPSRPSQEPNPLEATEEGFFDDPG
jgi:hypothetical protein